MPGWKKAAYDLIKRHPFLRLQVRRLLGAAKRVRYRLRAAGVPVEKRTVLFCSYHGAHCTCSPRAIYDEMAGDAAYRDYSFLWAVRDPAAHPDLAAAPRTELVRFGGADFERAMARAGTWVFNSTLPEHIFPRRGQRCLQCWHGTPLKRLGFDIADDGNAMNAPAEIRRRYRLEAEKLTWFLSPSPFASACFRSAWPLEACGVRVLEAGYPRNDRLARATEADRKAARAVLGLPDGVRAVLYAPTFRDDEHISGEGYACRPAVDFARLRGALGEGYVILFRAHYLVASAFDFDALGGFVRDVSGVEEINDLYLAADLLVTDYSSTMFDYAVLRRPILFYMYDLERYRDRLRGFYFDPEELPGRILRREEDLGSAIRAAERFRWTEEWEAFRRRFAPLEDGHAARRVLRAVFGEERDHELER